ncbi:utp11 protein [Ditylenchus destructor]|nr:utp11 protein [Ditylenchus destructor]
MPGNQTIRGHIEKKKDWIRRARDFQEKNNKLKHLRQKAEERNPDEFHFHMVRSQVGLDGVHRELDSSEEEDTEIQKLMGDVRDLKYVNHKLALEQRKIDKLKSTLHFSEVGPSKNTHIIFANSAEEAKNMLSTKSSLMNEESNVKNEDDFSDQLAEKERRRQYNELLKRMQREKELRVVSNKIELKKNLTLSKKSQLKPKLVEKGAPAKAAVYRWTYERKK